MLSFFLSLAACLIFGKGKEKDGKGWDGYGSR